jgi:ABC-2 type transport system permease protein
MKEALLILLPGAMYFWVLFIGQGPMQEILYDKETHILPRILACPVTITQFVLSKMLRCFVLCGLTLTMLLIFSSVLFGIKWGHPLKVAAVLVLSAASMTGLLALIYSLARTREQSNVISPVVLLLCAMIGGSMFPFDNLPPFLQTLGSFTPNRWSVLALQGVARAKSWLELATPLAGLAALAAVGSLVALFIFRRRLILGGAR